MRAVGLLGAALLLGGGLALLLTQRREMPERGVERLRALLEAGEVPKTERSALAAAWTEVTRAIERAGSRSAWSQWAESQLERAGWPLRVGEFVVLVAGSGAAAGLLLAATAGPAGALLGVLFGASVPLVLLQRQGRRTGERADGQLPDLLGRLAASLRAGHSLDHALEYVAERAPAPLGPEFARVLAETRLGRPFDEALAAMAERVGSVDLRWSVRAILVQRRTGGHLADILDVLADFMREREEVRREVRALTADGRMSAAVLIGLPFAVAGALLVVSPGYLAPLVTEPLGLVMSIGAGLLMTVATLWIRRTVRVEV